MGISIAICEDEAPSALCTCLRKDIKKVSVSEPELFGDAAEFDELVSLEEAHALFPDYEAFIKRNRINEESDAIYMEKVKKDADREILAPKAVKKLTGWVFMDRLDEAGKAKAMEMSLPENRITGWDCLDFDGMNETCGKCTLSWDKGRGCLGAFGPDNSLLPEIAARRECPLIASVPQSAKDQKRFTSEDAVELKREVELLTEVLPEEGKMMVRRYSGPLERMGAVADISIREGCGFYFF